MNRHDQDTYLVIFVIIVRFI